LRLNASLAYGLLFEFPGILEDMSDSLANILSNKNFDEPPEIAAIKKFVQDNYQEDVEVLVREHNIVIAGRSASLVNTLRLDMRQLQAAAQTEKRLVFRIG